MEKQPRKQVNKLQSEPETIRLNKYLAISGIASRRKADELIKKGHVTVNDQVVLEMGYRVKKEDVVTFKGEVIQPETEKVYILLNKPKNVITTVSDEKGRRTVMDLVKKVAKVRVYPVGRLDRDTTGLLLISNDGDLAKKLTHPSHGVKKIYHAILDKPLKEADFQKIKDGLTLEDGPALVDQISYLQGQPETHVGLEIHIGRNRIVRRIFEHVGYTVIKLDRVYFGGLTKKKLQRGYHRFLSEKEVIMLKHFS